MHGRQGPLPDQWPERIAKPNAPKPSLCHFLTNNASCQNQYPAARQRHPNELLKVKS